MTTILLAPFDDVIGRHVTLAGIHDDFLGPGLPPVVVRCPKKRAEEWVVEHRVVALGAAADVEILTTPAAVWLTTGASDGNVPASPWRDLSRVWQRGHAGLGGLCPQID